MHNTVKLANSVNSKYLFILSIKAKLSKIENEHSCIKNETVKHTLSNDNAILFQYSTYRWNTIKKQVYVRAIHLLRYIHF